MCHFRYPGVEHDPVAELLGHPFGQLLGSANESTFRSAVLGDDERDEGIARVDPEQGGEE